MIVGQRYKLNSEKHIDVKVCLKNSIQDRRLKGTGQWIIKKSKRVPKKEGFKKRVINCVEYG